MPDSVKKGDAKSNSALFKIWLSIGLQSFGGGVTTMTLIRRTSVDRFQWITEEEFNRNWALCQMTPGINLIALTILVGRQTAGLRGAAIATIGMVLPSAAITALMTAGFVAISHAPAVAAILGGILPASIGLGLVTSLQMAKAPMQQGRRTGISKFAFSGLLLASSAVLMYLDVASTPIILIGAGMLAALENVLRHRLSKKAEAVSNPLILFGYMLRAALLSTGGLGNVSSLHNSLVKPGLTTDAKFVESLTVGQISPGPNGLWVVSLGYLMLGYIGAAVSLAGIMIPPLLILGVEKLYSRVKHHPAVEGFVFGLTIAVVGTVVSVMVKLLQGMSHDGLKLCLAALAFVLGWIPRIPVVLVFVLCGLIGFLMRR